MWTEIHTYTDASHNQIIHRLFFNLEAQKMLILGVKEDLKEEVIYMKISKKERVFDQCGELKTEEIYSGQMLFKDQ